MAAVPHGIGISSTVLENGGDAGTARMEIEVYAEIRNSDTNSQQLISFTCVLGFC